MRFSHHRFEHLHPVICGISVVSAHRNQSTLDKVPEATSSSACANEERARCPKPTELADRDTIQEIHHEILWTTDWASLSEALYVQHRPLRQTALFYRMSGLPGLPLAPLFC
uniref:Uncharacterized protein n=1 Tax=Knipowitschia caucasica TaxID=637954 RepID=A0AAV2LUQ4_KNICA